MVDQAAAAAESGAERSEYLWQSAGDLQDVGKNEDIEETVNRKPKELETMLRCRQGHSLYGELD